MVSSGCQPAAAPVAKLLVVMAHWTEIKSQVPKYLAMIAIVRIISQVTAKARTFISQWATPETMPPTISPTIMPLYLTREWQVSRLIPRCLLRANTQLATTSYSHHNLIWWQMSTHRKLLLTRDSSLRTVPPITSQYLPKVLTCCRVAMWWHHPKMSRTTNISSFLKTNLFWTKWLCKPRQEFRMISSNKTLSVLFWPTSTASRSSKINNTLFSMASLLALIRNRPSLFRQVDNSNWVITGPNPYKSKLTPCSRTACISRLFAWISLVNNRAPTISTKTHHQQTICWILNSTAAPSWRACLLSCLPRIFQTCSLWPSRLLLPSTNRIWSRYALRSTSNSRLTISSRCQQPYKDWAARRRMLTKPWASPRLRTIKVDLRWATWSNCPTALFSRSMIMSSNSKGSLLHRQSRQLCLHCLCLIRVPSRLAIRSDHYSWRLRVPNRRQLLRLMNQRFCPFPRTRPILFTFRVSRPMPQKGRLLISSDLSSVSKLSVWFLGKKGTERKWFSASPTSRTPFRPL